MTDEILTKKWLAQRLEQDRLAAEKAAQERRDEQAREGLRAAYRDETGWDPSDAELKTMVAEMHRDDAITAARLNEARASRQVRQSF